MSEQGKPDDAKPDARDQSELISEYERRLDEIADLVSRVRHELNNPLTGVLGQVQLLLREDLNERARRRAETIEQLTLRLTTIVSDLRDVQKPTRSSS